MTAIVNVITTNKLIFGISISLLVGCKQSSKFGIDLQQKGTLKDYDGNVYDWIKIGDQIWMAENLKVSHYANGAPIPDGTKIHADSINKNSKYRFVYNDSIIYKEEYGLRYTWAAALNGQNYESSNDQIQGACPNGWYIPGDEEWFVLETFLGVPENELNNLGGRGENAGGKLKKNGFSLWQSPNVGATNEVLFNAKPLDTT